MQMDVIDMIRRFREAAIRKGDGSSDPRLDSRLHAQMAETCRELDAQGESGSAALRSLLHDESAWVRSWVAAHLLSRRDDQARPVLEALAEDSGLVGFAAQMVLDEFRKGRLKSPFGGPDA